MVDLNFTTSPFYGLEEAGTPKGELYRTQAKADLTVWKRHLIEVLKDSPSKERKFLRWKVCGSQRGISRSVQVVIEEGELEVLPETSL